MTTSTLNADVNITVFDESHRQGVVSLWRQTFADDPPWNEPNAVIDAKLQVDPGLFLVALSGARVAGNTSRS